MDRHLRIDLLGDPRAAAARRAFRDHLGGCLRPSHRRDRARVHRAGTSRAHPGLGITTVTRRKLSSRRIVSASREPQRASPRVIDRLGRALGLNSLWEPNGLGEPDV